MVKIFCLNVQTWSTRRAELTSCILEEKPDVVLLGSTGLKEEDAISIPGYYFRTKTWNLPRTSGHEHLADGWAIGFRRGLRCQVEGGFEDILFLRLHLPETDVLIGTVYLPPRLPADRLPLADIQRICDFNIPAYIAGDLNAMAKVLGHDRPNAIGSYLDRMTALNRLNVLGPDFCTYYAHNSRGTKPDIIFSNSHHWLSYYCQPGPPTSSDHETILFQLDSRPIYLEVPERYDWRRTNWELFQSLLEDSPNLAYDIARSDLEDTIERELQYITGAIERATPKTRFRKVYHSFGTGRLRRLRSELKIASLEHSHGVPVWDRIVSLRREIAEEGKAAHRAYWNRMVSKLSDLQGQQFWSSVKGLTGGTRRKAVVRSEDGTELTNSQLNEKHRAILTRQFVISDEDDKLFDKDFARSIETRVRNLRLEWDENEMLSVPKHVWYSLIKGFANKAPGPSGITRNHLLRMPSASWKWWSFVLSRCLQCGIFPRSFKEGRLVMVPKVSRPVTPSDFRPITLLEIMGKVFEKYLESVVKSTNFYHRSHHGFRGERSVCTAIALLYETMSAKISTQKMHLVMRDVSKAFDRVWHTGLKSKIARLSLQPNIKACLFSFLDDREVQFEGTKIPLRAGVPQGSCLSPTLYNVYLMDLPCDDESQCLTVSYADDISQLIWHDHWGKGSRRTKDNAENRELYRVKCDEQLKGAMANVLKINSFERRWKIKTNRAKFQILPIAGKKKITYDIGDEVRIEPAHHGKLLGLRLDRFNCNPHCKERLAIARGRLKTLKKLNVLDSAKKLLLYKMVLRPILGYPAIPLNTISLENLRLYESFDRQAARWIYNIPWTDFVTNTQLEETMREANWLPMNQFLHNQASNEWDRIALAMPDEYTHLKLHLRDEVYKKSMPSSLLTVFKTRNALDRREEEPPLWGPLI
jgi:hypothetical protein